jgi:hypothetical protein
LKPPNMDLGIRTVPEGRLRQGQGQVPRLLFMLGIRSVNSFQ